MRTTNSPTAEILTPTLGLAPITRADSAQTSLLLDFATAIFLGVQTGATFQLADGSTMASSIPETGDEITAYMVREGLRTVAEHWKAGGQMKSLVEIQQYLVVWAALLNFHAPCTGRAVNDHLMSSMSACSDFEDAIFDRYED